MLGAAKVAMSTQTNTVPAVAVATDWLTWLSLLPATSTWKMSCPSSWGLWGRGGLQVETDESQTSHCRHVLENTHSDLSRRGQRAVTGKTLNTNHKQALRGYEQVTIATVFWVRPCQHGLFYPEAVHVALVWISVPGCDFISSLYFRVKMTVFWYLCYPIHLVFF